MDLKSSPLKPIHDWVKDHERTWSERFGHLDVYWTTKQQQEEEDGSDDE